MDDEQIEDEEADEEYGVVLVCLDGIGVTVDEVGGVGLGAGGRDGREPDGLDPVGRPVDDKVVALLEDPTGGLGL